MIGCIWPIREEESSQSTVAFADECAMDNTGDKAVNKYYCSTCTNYREQKNI